ncbi:DUF4287 domain-containing protein [Pontixanthobacter aquaemixtae]|uniref:DUF4287 domain-containing protein n=1 Tax=Pontixanthobacter aquaemixtae TaxID=1958940 RepID=A0A844ZP06_9SPHN|nr:DUF4287 domain-containing protein [Pontixanthobacter aquaemixtae]MXO89463.1 DUF4287 domain-containing protein [Pontixanthobacter aquaemixtae]
MATPEQQLATMLANIPEKTGKPLEEWLALIAAQNFAKHGEIMAFLKGEHGISHGFANLIAAKSKETGEEVDQVAEQYSGAKAGLKPIHDAIVEFAKSLGSDVEIAPKKASVSLRRKKQFALITPATKTRIDLGLALKGDDATGRLESYNAMCSHRVRLETAADFDSEVQTWMREAYNRSG